MNEMLAMDVIAVAQTESVAPIMFAPEKDGMPVFYLDYCKLNTVTICDSHPILRMGECTDSLGDVPILSTVDANSGYWKVEVAHENLDKTAFTSRHGLFRFIRMPFGLKVRPVRFNT